jgi:hypothetical protein
MSLHKTYDDLAAAGTALVMIIRNEEMPSIYVAAQNGDEDAQMRLAAVGSVVPAIAAGEHNCVFCARQTLLNDLAALAFVSKKIEPGAAALFTLVCNGCDERDPQNLVSKIMERLNFKRLHHEAGHA